MKYVVSKEYIYVFKYLNTYNYHSRYVYSKYEKVITHTNELRELLNIVCGDQKKFVDVIPIMITNHKDLKHYRVFYMDTTYNIDKQKQLETSKYPTALIPLLLSVHNNME